mgnify:CR=1 FL=1
MAQTDSEEAEKVMARVMAAIDAERIAQDGAAFPMPTRCCGIAAYPQDGDKPRQLFVVADSRLYMAKKSKGSRVGDPALATSETSWPQGNPVL